VVYRAEVEELAEPETAPPVVRLELPGSATGWTASGDGCLEQVGHYAWSLRAVGVDGSVSAWSAPSLFEVVERPFERELRQALAVLQRYLQIAGEERAGERAVEEAAPTGVHSINQRPGDAPSASPTTVAAAPATVVGDSDLKVNESPVITAATLPPPRRFYVTASNYPTSLALTACAAGYHMASLWEILDPSNLIYDFAHPNAKTFADSGQGPAANWYGRVRTGQVVGSSPSAGIGNCSAWSSDSSGQSGSFARLDGSWETPTGELNGIWDVATFACSIIGPVWCVSD
jgi:hypothetical protein